MPVKLSKPPVIFLFLISYLCAETAYSSEPYFALEESFALSTTVENGKYPISTFIPRTMLLYVSDREQTKTISNRKYLKVKTQDGVSVFVDESTVSKKTYRKILGENEVIFNSAVSICKKVGCDSSSDVDTWEIHAGDAFRLDQNRTDGFLKLTGFRYGQEISGYVSPDNLDEFIEKGVVTRTDRIHPKYIINKVKSNNLNTRCGEIVSKGTSKRIGGSIDIEIPILSAFGIGVSGGGGAEKTINITTSYGAKGHEYVFYIYKIKDSDTSQLRKFVVQVDYECQEGPLISPRSVINRVDIQGKSIINGSVINFV